MDYSGFIWIILIYYGWIELGKVNWNDSVERLKIHWSQFNGIPIKSNPSFEFWILILINLIWILSKSIGKVNWNDSVERCEQIEGDRIALKRIRESLMASSWMESDGILRILMEQKQLNWAEVDSEGLI